MGCNCKKGKQNSVVNRRVIVQSSYTNNKKNNNNSPNLSNVERVAVYKRLRPASNGEGK